MIEVISPISSIYVECDLTTYITDNFTLDRYLGDTLTLPYSFEEVKIKANELASQVNVINSALYKLYHNFAYLNAQAKLINNDYPSNYTGFIAGGGFANGYGWFTSSTSTSATTVTAICAFDGVSDIATIEDPTALNTFAIFIAEPTHLFVMSSDHDETTISTILSTDTVNQATNITFGNIARVITTSDKRLILLDSTLRTVTKFNIDNVITSNPGLSAVLLIEEVIGGLSQTAFDKTRFHTPIDIAVGPNDQVYVLDTGNQNIKIYDRDLNWITTLHKPADFVKGTAVDIEVDSDGVIYLLFSSGKLISYDPDTFKIREELTFEEPLSETEVYKRLVFSKNNENILYVLSTESIFKKFKSKLSRSIGKFRLSENNINAETFSAINLLDTIRTDYDYVYVYSQNAVTGGKILEFNETVEYDTVVYDAYKAQIYGYNDIRISADEFITAYVYNKALKKMVYNHLKFRDNIHHTFIASYDSTGAIRHEGYEGYGKSGVSLDSFSESQDFYIANNEILADSVVNRTLSKIYDLQISLKSILTERYTNSYPLTSQYISLKNAENSIT